MPTYLDEAAIIGTAPKAEAAAPAAPPGKYLSEEQITGTTPFEAEARRGPTLLGEAAEVGKTLAGTAAQVSDMFTGIGKSLLGVAPYWGTRVVTTALGEDARTSALAAQQMKEHFFPAEVSAPWSKVAESLGPEAQRAYEDNPVAWIMGKVSTFIQSGSEKVSEATGLQPEDFVALADQFMGSLGWKAVRPGIQKAFKARVEEMKAGKEAKAAAKEAAAPTETPEGVPLENPDPARYRPQYEEGKLVGWEDISKPVTEAEAGAVTSAEVKALFKEAKKKGRFEEADVETVKRFFEEAKKQGGEIDPELLKWMAGSFAVGAAGAGIYAAYREWQDNKEQMRQMQEEIKQLKEKAAPPKEETPQPLPSTIIPKDKRWIKAETEDTAITAAAIGALTLKAKWAAPAAEALSRVGKGLDYTLGNVSTRLGSISPALKLRARDFERNVLQNTDAALDVVHPFLKEARALKGAEAEKLNLALLQNDPHAIAAAMEGKPELVRGYWQVRDLLDKFEETHKALGRFKEGITEYFPRVVKDLPGLKAALGTEAQTRLEVLLARAEAKMVKEQQRGLTDIEQSIIVNRFLNSADAGSYLPGYARGRHVKDLTAQLAPFYEKPTDSLLRYVSAATQDIETARFFGKNLSNRKLGGKILTDVDASIGNIVADELAAGRLAPEGANELRSILKSRFQGGEKSTAGLLQDVRNVTNIGLLGSFNAAATQIGDSIMTVYHHGLLPTLSALKGQLTGKPLISTKEFGLVNHIAEELGSARHTGRALQYVFKLNGFQAIDQFAKKLNINAGLIKNQRLARTPQGQLQLAMKYQAAFGDEFPALLRDLQQGVKSENVRSLLFSELSDAQPITKMEMPQAYLDHPNGRLLYQMKTYMLKQMDVIRRDAYQEIKKGNYVRGARNLVGLAVALSLSNLPGDLVKDFLSGRELDLSKIDHVENLLQNFGLNRYTLDKLEGTTPAKGAAEFAMGTVKPPILGMAADIDKPERLLKYVPSVGRLVYDRYYGGNEARKALEQKREKLAKRAAEEKLYPWKKEARLKRLQAAAEKKRRKLEMQP